MPRTINSAMVGGGGEFDMVDGGTLGSEHASAPDTLSIDHHLKGSEGTMVSILADSLMKAKAARTGELTHAGVAMLIA